MLTVVLLRGSMLVQIRRCLSAVLRAPAGPTRRPTQVAVEVEGQIREDGIAPRRLEVTGGRLPRLRNPQHSNKARVREPMRTSHVRCPIRGESP